MCTLFVPDQDKVISVASEHLEPVCPEKGDRVSVDKPLYVYCAVVAAVLSVWRTKLFCIIYSEAQASVPGASNKLGE